MDIAFTGLPEQVVAGDTLRLTLRISNPYPYAIGVCGDRSLVMLWKHGRFRVEEFDTGEHFNIPAGDTITREVRFVVPEQLSGAGFDAGFALRRDGYTNWFNGKPLRGSGVFIDFGITYLCKEWLRLNKYLANSLGFLCASTSNYVLNRIWTFHNENPDIAGQYLRFLGIAAVGLVINNLTIYLLHERWKLNFYLAKLFAIGVVTFWNFFMNYFFTF